MLKARPERKRWICAVCEKPFYGTLPYYNYDKSRVLWHWSPCCNSSSFEEGAKMFDNETIAKLLWALSEVMLMNKCSISEAFSDQHKQEMYDLLGRARMTRSKIHALMAYGKLKFGGFDEQ